MTHADERPLESDTEYRFGYLSEFIGFESHDIETIHAAAPLLTRLVTGAYDASMVQYLDMVGKIHTPAAGSPALDVPLVQMNALLGFVATALTQTILSCGLDRETESRMLLAFGKLLWVQNDLITRHYQSAA